MIDLKELAVTLARQQAEKYRGITIRKLPSGEYEATHYTFDPDPESRWHVRGTGLTEDEAANELLEVLPKPQPLRCVYSSPFEPPEFEPVPYDDPDEQHED